MNRGQSMGIVFDFDSVRDSDRLFVRGGISRALGILVISMFVAITEYLRSTVLPLID